MKGSRGIDVSKYQGSIQWNKVKAAGIEFVIPRSGWDVDCDGKGVDDRFLEYVRDAQSAGIEVPAVYHMLYAHDERTAMENAACAINAVRRAGLPQSTIIWLDQEEHTVIKEKELGYNVTVEMQKKMAVAFCDYVLNQGYKTGIYLNHDYINRVYGKDILQKYDIWYSDPNNAHPEQKCLYRQTSWHGRIDGIGVDVDLDVYEGDAITGGETLGKLDAFLNALETKSDGRYHYYDGSSNSRGCSAFVEECLRDAGIITQGETFHAGSGDEGILTDASRFERVPWNPSNLRKGDILWSDNHHVAVWDGHNGVWEAAPENSHYKSDNGKTGVGHFSTHSYYNCGTGTNDWTCIFRIKEAKETGKLKASEYVKCALKLLERPLAYRNTFPYNCGLLDSDGVTWGDCWNINPKTTLWSLKLDEPICDNQIVGEGHVLHIYTDGIKASGLPDCTGDTIMNQYCTETTFRAMLEAKKAPCLLFINGMHMGAYLGEFKGSDGKIYNVSEFSSNDALGGKMRSYVDEYGQRITHKGGTVIGSWNRCGYLTAFLDYENEPTPEPVPEPTPEPTPTPSYDISDIDLALAIYAGKWGVNPERKKKIIELYGEEKYKTAQSIVDKIVSAMNWYRIEINLAREILAGKWGVNPERQNGITLQYGANAYRIAQGFVNSIKGKEYTIEQLETAYNVALGILSGIYGDGQDRKNKIDSQYGETVRKLAQRIVDEVLR